MRRAKVLPQDAKRPRIATLIAGAAGLAQTTAGAAAGKVREKGKEEEKDNHYSLCEGMFLVMHGHLLCTGVPVPAALQLCVDIVRC